MTPKMGFADDGALPYEAGAAPTNEFQWLWALAFAKTTAGFGAQPGRKRPRIAPNHFKNALSLTGCRAKIPARPLT
ncbi:hypothetical protein ACVIGA_008120 [Bradyrhizobium sp. USDA 3240]